MKKSLVLILMILLLVGCSVKVDKKGNNNKEEPITPVETESKVTINLFHWNSCSHCQEEKEWLKGLKEKNKDIFINYYEITEESNLFKSVREALSIPDESVPLTIIGTDYVLGYSGATKTKIMNLIDKYKKLDYCDLVETVKNGEDTSTCFTKNS